MGALVQTLPHHHRLRPAKEGSAPSSPVPGFFDRPAFRRISSLRSRSGPQSCSPLDQAHPLRGSRDFYTRAFLTAGHPTAKSGITTQLSGLLLRRNLHPLGKCCYGLQLRSAGITPPPGYCGPSATLSSSTDFPGAPVIRPTQLRRFRGGTRRVSPVARRVLVTVPPLPPRRRAPSRRPACDGACCLRAVPNRSASGVLQFRGHRCVHSRCGPGTRSPSSRGPGRALARPR